MREPFPPYVSVAGKAELAKKLGLPDSLPANAVAFQFVSELKRGTLSPKPVLFSAKHDGRKTGQPRSGMRSTPGEG